MSMIMFFYCNISEVYALNKKKNSDLHDLSVTCPKSNSSMTVQVFYSIFNPL